MQLSVLSCTTVLSEQTTLFTAFDDLYLECTAKATKDPSARVEDTVVHTMARVCT